MTSLRTTLGCCLLLATLLAGTGCRTTTPLTALPAEKRDGLTVKLFSGSPAVVYSTVTGRNARQAGAGGGLLGYAICASIGSASESGGRKDLAQIRAATGDFEAALVLEQLNTQLQATGISADGSTSGRTLSLKITAVGLTEVRGAFVAPYVCACVDLADTGQSSTWSATANSTGTHLRLPADYAANPNLYREDFNEVAADIAHQLVVGPLR